MSIMAYVKEHPWATGTIVVVGGIIFIMIVRGSGGSTATVASGPSDAEVAANAAITAAQINAQAQGAQAGAAVQAASIGAGVQMNSDNKAAEVTMAQITATQAIYDKYFDSSSEVAKAQVAANENVQQSVVAASGSKNAKNSKVASVLATVASGQPVSYVQPPSDNYGNSAAGIIGAVGNTAKSILPFL